MYPTFNCYYNILREEADVHRTINWPYKIPQEKWTLTLDGGRKYVHMTTNFVELINSILKKSRNLLISVLVKSKFLKCNAWFNNRGREAIARFASGQVYTQVLNKAIEVVRRKAKAHIALEFH